jgi:hypothetical protein
MHLVPLIVGSAVTLHATTATADSNSLFYGTSSTKTGSASWSWFDPGFFDTITWTSGTNHADGTAFTHTDTSELKFKFTLTPPATTYTIGGKTFTGFSYSDGPGAAGSVATTSGAGSSTYTKKLATATWTVTAAGTLGAAPPPIPSYDSTDSGNDPWSVTADDLVGLTGGYSLFFAAGLQSATFSPNGSVGYDVAYTTGSGSMDLLNVALNSSGAVTTTSLFSGLTIFSLPSVGVDPSTFTGTPLSTSDLQNLFQADLSGNSLSSPIYLGFLLNGLSIPTIDMGNGVLAQVSETATANDRAQGSPAPEPGSLALFGCGLSFIGLACYCRRQYCQAISISK